MLFSSKPSYIARTVHTQVHFVTKTKQTLNVRTEHNTQEPLTSSSTVAVATAVFAVAAAVAATAGLSRQRLLLWMRSWFLLLNTSLHSHLWKSAVAVAAAAVDDDEDDAAAGCDVTVPPCIFRM